METLLKTTIGWKQAALAAIAAAAIGCAGQVSTTPLSQGTHELAAVELPDVGGCSEVASAGALVNWEPVAGVADLYIVRLGGRAVCIDSSEGVRLAFGTRAYAASNPMPGDPGTAASNPMPGDPGSGDASSNPMPGDPGNAASNPMPGDNASGSGSSSSSSSSNHH
jgi:hypothetical protein